MKRLQWKTLLELGIPAIVAAISVGYFSWQISAPNYSKPSANMSKNIPVRMSERQQRAEIAALINRLNALNLSKNNATQELIRRNLSFSRPDEVVIPSSGEQDSIINSYLDCLKIAAKGKCEAVFQMGLFQAMAVNEKPETRRLKIVYNRPKRLTFGKPSRLIASIAAHSLKEAKLRVASGTGPVIAASADLAYRVRAELEGSEEVVKIEKNGPDTRMVDERANTTWTWFVTPKTTEPITLTLSFYNEFHRDGEVGENDGPAYETTFQVNASWRDRFVLFITDLNPIYAVIAGLVTTIGGGLIWIRNWRKKPEPIHGGRNAMPHRNWFRRRW